MLNAIFRPLETWPGTPTHPDDRRTSPFSATYTQTLDLLEQELGHLEATNIVIQGFFTRDQLRNDGWPKGGQNPSSPGVILMFRDSQGDPYSYPCDSFTWWTANLRAIALALEALRKIDRYGVTRRGEQYQGFRALPPAQEARPQMQPEEAAAFLASHIPGVSPEALTGSQQLFEAMFRMLQKQIHPDSGGSHDEFVRLQEAGAALTEHFKAQKAAGA